MFHALALACIALAGLAAYANSFHVPFVFDDQNNIVNNQHVRWHSLEWWQWRDAARESRNRNRPVAYISFGLNHYFGALDVWGYHAVNLAIHLLCAALVYGLALTTLRRVAPPGADPPGTPGARWVALATALIFVSHPIQTQAVTYVVQRMTSLCALFYLAALLLYVRGRTVDGPGRRWLCFGGSLLAWLLALGTKQTAATLPLVILLYEWFFFADLSRAWLRRSVMFAVPALLLVALLAFVYLGTSPLERLQSGYAVRDFTLGQRLLTEPRVLVFYLSLVLWPAPSRFSLTHDIAPSHSLFDPATTCLSFAVLLGLAALAAFSARRYRILAFGIAWFFITLAIESSVVPLEMAYEHRMYLPMAGICLLSAWGLFRVARSPRVAILASVALALSLVAATHQRNRVWQNESSLWEDVVAKYPMDARAQGNLGDARVRAGELELAVAAFDAAIRLKPNYLKAYVNRGRAFAALGQRGRALEEFDRAIDLPREAVHLSRDYDYAYRERGLMYLQAGQYQRANDDFTRAIQAGMKESGVYNLRAGARAGMGDFEGALRDYTSALRIDPDSKDAHNNLAWLRATSRDPAFLDADAALMHATRACELSNWEDPSSFDTLAAAYARRGEFDQAVAWQKKAVALMAGEQQQELQERLDLYASGRPFQETSAPSALMIQ